MPRVRELVLREALFPAADAALLMVSGGQDSLTLLEILGQGLLGKAGPADLQALHVNHHLRGEESEADERLVREHCSRLGVRLTVVDRSLAKGTGNLMESAREARRRAALDVAREVGARRIVLGHTLDDQVETMLYRLGRYVRPTLGAPAPHLSSGRDCRFLRDQGPDIRRGQGQRRPRLFENGRP